MTDEVEVLVHISTSATRQNDMLYRSLAKAYTEFEPSKTHRDENGKRSKARFTSGMQGADTIPTSSNRAIAPENVHPAPTASKESYGSFPSDLSSDWRHQDHGSIPEDSVRPVNHMELFDRSYISWRKSEASRSKSKRDQDLVKTSSDGFEDADTGFIEDSQAALEALQSQLSDLCSVTSADTSEDEEEEEEEEEEDAGVNFDHNRVHCDTIIDGNQDLSTPGEEPLLELSEHRSQASPRSSPSKEHTSTSLPSVEASQYAIDRDGDQLDFSNLPTDAFPPPPAISVESPTALPSQITKHLAVLKTRNPDRFKPLRVGRSLQPDERGYWRIDCTKMRPDLQQDFWSSLYGHVCSGRIGWGTTLHRDSDSAYALGVVRLYCWGEVVEHFWLLLWLCSNGMVVSLGLRWIDADGVAVVEMD